MMLIKIEAHERPPDFFSFHHAPLQLNCLPSMNEDADGGVDQSDR